MASHELLIALLKEDILNHAKKSHLKFIQHTWMKGQDDPFIVGYHTQKICQRIDRAFEDYRKGKSSYILINVHQRSGKSDIVSRYLGPHWLGEFPGQEVMQVTYQANLSVSFSSFGRNIFRSEKYKELYPDISLSTEANKKNDWLIVDKACRPTGGKLYASGLQSGLTGNGFALGILDDYCAGRAEAESRVQRDNAWDAFTNDFMTRRAPVCIVIVLATVWHWDDITGRIINEMKNNDHFPQFDLMQFPAKARDYHTPEDYPGEYLFLNRFSAEWYKSQYATLGKYAAAALMDCDPQLRTGGILSTAGIVWHDFDDPQIPGETTIQWARVWDLAHTQKERSGDDPDYTSGTLLAFQLVPGDPVFHLWIKHRTRFREGAKKRDEQIALYADQDGHFIWQAIESSIDAKDAFHYLSQSLPAYTFRPIFTSGDKVVRATPLESIFECPGHVHVIRGSWNEDWLDEIMKFTGTGQEHDDGIDNLSAGYALLCNAGSLQISEKAKSSLKHRRTL